MCGIAGIHVKDPKVIKKHDGVELLVNELLKGIEHRGKHATGFVSVGFDGKVTLDKAPKTASEFIEDRDRIPEGVQTILLHTRHWTQGSPEHTENNHPVVYGTCFAVHNGHISNDKEVFEELDLKRSAEVDSIAIAAAGYYHGIGEPADIKATLEQLKGGFATAIINPITHRGRVVLAKGPHSPLYVVDTRKFIVWASTIETIKDAWGKVLGTPPQDDKIEKIEEGNFLIVDGDTVTRDKFTVRRPFVSAPKPKPTSGTTHGRNGNARASASWFGKQRQPEVPNVLSEASEEIKGVIEAAGHARHFDAHQAGLYGEDDFNDVEGDRKWEVCLGCNRLILRQDMTATEYGTICVDCVVGVRHYLDAQGGDDEDTLAGTDVPRVSPGDRDSLEVWADYEKGLHREVLEQMSKDCGSYYSPQAIEFLCFFTTSEYREVAGAAVNTLITELHRLYEETYMDIAAEAFGYVEQLDEPLLLEAGPSASEDGFCFQHNRAYVKAEGCSGCETEAEMAAEARLAAMLDHGSEDEPELNGEACGVEPFAESGTTITRSSVRSHNRSSRRTEDSKKGNAADDTGGEVIDLPRCGNCGTYVLRATEESCVLCRAERKNDKAHEGAACGSCDGLEVKYVVGFAGKNYYYCATCFNRCGKLIHDKSNNTVSLCNAEPKHMLKDGLRVCHTHVRRQSGSISTTNLFRRGATLTELT